MDVLLGMTLAKSVARRSGGYFLPDACGTGWVLLGMSTCQTYDSIFPLKLRTHP